MCETSSWCSFESRYSSDSFSSDGSMTKPPRHRNNSMYEKKLEQLWCEVLHLDKIPRQSDLFDDLDADEEHAVAIVNGMRALGLKMSISKMFTLDECTLRSVLTAAL